jgi:threonylcarbamoyladenosine tRNA methylthiotransferase MtaB
MTTFHFLNFGCRASQADGASLKRQLIEAGLDEVAGTGQGHVAVLNTCTVTAAADAEVRQMIRRIHRANPGCRILVTGCYAQRAPQEIAQLPGVSWVVGNSHKHYIAEVLGRAKKSGDRRQKTEDGPEGGLVQIGDRSPNLHLSSAASLSVTSNPERRTPDAGLLTPDSATVLVGAIPHEFHFAPVFADDRTRPTLKVQDGCNARCSFCVIPEVRGPSRSLAPQKVVEQVRELERCGYREIVLSGINLGSYGKDFDRRINFLGLLERILAETAIPRVRISSIEPMDVSPALIRLVAKEPRVARHFHVPLQSGSDRILRQMNRRYWARQYAERILAVQERIPNCGIGADVMVGFPGETAQDHAVSLRFIESLPFTYLHIFPYSARPATPAAARPDQLNGRVIRDRGQEIRAVIARKRQAFLQDQAGRTLSALTLDTTRQGSRVALSSNYLNVALPGAEVPPNTLTDVRIGRAHEGILYGYPEGDRRSAGQREQRRGIPCPQPLVPSP